MKNVDMTTGKYKMTLLGVLCAICGLLLSVVNAVTAPVIAANTLKKELAGLKVIYPDAEFAEVKDYTDESGLIRGVYEAKGEGYVFKCFGIGYNSSGFTYLVGFNNDGTVAGFTKIEENETDGFGKRCFEEDYTNQILALTSTDEVPLLTGATLTSTAIKKGIDAAKVIFNDLNNIEYDPSSESTPEPEKDTGLALNGDYSKYNVTVEEVSNDGKTAVYACKADGFGLLNNMGADYSQNEATVTIDLGTMTVVSVEVTKFGDTKGVGDLATSADALAAYAGKGASDSVDSVSGATFTATSVAAMVSGALEAAAGGSSAAEKDPYADYNATAEEVSNDGKTAVYACKADGFGLLNNMGADYSQNEANVTIDLGTMKVVSVEVTKFGDTKGVGDLATSADALAAYVGLGADDTADTVTGATFTSNSIAAMVRAALAAAGK